MDKDINKIENTKKIKYPWGFITKLAKEFGLSKNGVKHRLEKGTNDEKFIKRSSELLEEYMPTYTYRELEEERLKILDKIAVGGSK